MPNQRSEKVLVANSNAQKSENARQSIPGPEFAVGTTGLQSWRQSLEDPPGAKPDLMADLIQPPPVPKHALSDLRGRDSSGDNLETLGSSAMKVHDAGEFDVDKLD